MNIITGVATIVLFSLIISIGIVCASLIISYTKSKPPGLQSFMDQIMIEFQYVVVLFTLATLIPMGYGTAQASSINLDLARIVAFGSFTICIMLMLYLFVGILVKYVSIYHSTLLSGHFNEAKVILRLRIGLSLTAIFLAIFEYRYLSSLDTMLYYQILAFGSANSELAYSKVVTFFVVINLIIGIGLQIRIEYDNLIIGDQQGNTAHTTVMY
jgi:hypothetical protein